MPEATRKPEKLTSGSNPRKLDFQPRLLNSIHVHTCVRVYVCTRVRVYVWVCVQAVAYT